MSSTFKSYYQLTKPGIIRGNALSALAGFLLASKGHIGISTLMATLVGLSLIIGSACVYNNYLDRDIDRLMSRTKNRALVSGSISTNSALIYATILGLAGCFILVYFVNALSAYAALFGMFAYVILYGVAKRKTMHGTLVGSISGAMPPVVGYTAVSNEIDAAAIILFIILVAWQMPHFYGIALYRMKDYKAALIPVMPLSKGIMATKIQTMLYILAFGLAAVSLYYSDYLSYIYAAVMLSISAAWFMLGIRGFKSQNAIEWGRKMFLFSLIVMIVLCVSISLDASLS